MVGSIGGFVGRRRSRKGAWIEMMRKPAALLPIICRSRKGAWIEINGNTYCFSCETCRSREGAWIEISNTALKERRVDVAPVRERGLKLIEHNNQWHHITSLP